METLRVGVIGTGVLGRHHIRLYRQCPGVEAVGLFDVRAETARAVAGELGVRAFSSIDELADATDALSLAVPTALHFRVALPLLERGMHLLIEKPLAATVAEGEALVDAARRSGAVLAVGHVERFNPVLKVLDLLPGKPIFFQGERLSAFPPMRPGLAPRGTDASVVHDLMIHDLDLVLALTGDEVDHVDGAGGPVLSSTVDLANAHIVLAGGGVANLTASRVSASTVRRMRIYKPGGYVFVDFANHQAAVVTWGEGRMVSRKVDVSPGNALLCELIDFTEAVRATRQAGTPVAPRIPGDEGLRALRLAVRILDDISRRTGILAANPA